MKLTKLKLKQLIKEELKIVLNESPAPEDLIPEKYARPELDAQGQPWDVQKIDANEWAKKGLALASDLLNHVEDVPEYALWLLSTVAGDDLCELVADEGAAHGAPDMGATAEEVSTDLITPADKAAIMELDGDAVQGMLKHVDGRTLTTALSAYPEDLRDYILSNMSIRAATMIIEDIENLGPVSENQVREAHKWVMEAAAAVAVPKI